MRLRKYLSQIKMILCREISILRLNPSLILLLFGAPIVYSFLYTSIFVQKMERNVPIAIIDKDKSEKSRELIRHIDAHELVQVEIGYVSTNEAYKALQTFSCMAIILIPEGFEKNIKTGKQAKISVSINNTRFMIANDVVKGVNDAISAMAENISTEFFKKKGLNNHDAKRLANPLQVNSKVLFNTTESYGDFIIVGLLALILQQTLLIGVSVSMAHERETNLLNDLLHKISGSSLKLIIGKTGLYIGIYLFYALFFFTFHFYLFKLPFEGSFLALFIITIVQFVTIVISGLLIGSFFPSKLAGLIVLVFSSYPIFLLSGYSWPIQAFPDFLKIIAYLLPHTSYFQGYTIVTQNGGTLKDVIPQIIRICIIGTAILGVLTIRLHFLRKSHSCRPISSTIESI